MTAQDFLLEISDEDCLGCGNCMAVCPLSNPESPIFRKEKQKIRLKSGVAKASRGVKCREHPEVPDDCKDCTLFCPTNAINIVED